MVATIGGLEIQSAGIADVQWHWKDDPGQEHTLWIQSVLYFPKSPINILSVTKFVNQLNDEKGTGITTNDQESVFFYNHQQYSCMIVHTAFNLQEMLINDGFSRHLLWMKLVSLQVDTTKHHCHCSSLSCCLNSDSIR